ncbi:hypothetical protein llap_7472 [Limosa lapponica baueri]|uniref:Uncharacterized protein n=1 Tax=Limosa lapponica baueri TaxID=1758121 RepID=A0A2I0U860_LIMLA|nr:hypothetical protein llap_7472 [Limosa lapponica baueri]
MPATEFRFLFKSWPQEKRVFPLWSRPLSEGLSTLHRSVELCGESLWKPPVLPAELLPYYGQQDKDKGVRTGWKRRQEAVVAAKQMVSSLVRVALGSLQTLQKRGPGGEQEFSSELET